METFLPRQWLGALSMVMAGAIGAAQAATLPAGFSETQVASGLQSVTAMTIAPDGRVFVCEQTGRLRVIKNDTLLATPFLTVSVNASGERGLLGVAFDPDFATNRFLYIYYTTSSSPVHNRVSRFTANATNLDVAMSGTEVQILNLPNLSSATNHNGGAIHFGPDGKLYIAVGENANSANAPSLNTVLGKILRINKDGTIPSDNPFFTQTTGNNRAIWARGLRNPFTFAFQPGTGRLHLNDVGQDAWEEVNEGVAGSNYGWPAVEGPEPPGQAGVRYPIHNYQNAGSNCAIVGAAFYNPATSTFPANLTGGYFFGDFCGGFIRTLSPPTYTTASGFATNVPFLVDLAVSNDGFLYYLARGQQGTGSNGQVWKVRGPATCTAPSITDQPDSVTAAPNQSVTFTVVASGTQPLSYQWQRAPSGSNTFTNIAGATSPSLTVTATTADNGARSRVVVTNACGTVTSNAATLTVTANVPTATISQPADGTTYRGGQTIAFAGTGTNAQGGALPASAFTWQVDFHHADHVHPHVPATSGITSGSFVTSDRGHTEIDVFYRITLTVTSNGQTATDFVDVSPQIVTLSLASSPSGLAATLDGQPVTTPRTFQSVAGVFRTIGTSSPQTSGGATFTFDRWSDNGAMTHEIQTPTSNTTYTAFFQSDSTCVTAPAGQAWQNRALDTAQTGTFTARFDATPSISPIPGGGHVGLSLGTQNAYAGFATIVRFNASGNIDARNGGAYGAGATVPYTGGIAYHFRVVVNVPAHTYSIFVTPDGGSELTVGTNFALRTEQNTVTSLTSWGVFTAGTSGSVTVCDVAIEAPPVTCVTANAGGAFENRTFAAQTASFTTEFDATPSVAGINSVIGVSNGAQTAHTGFAAIARFNTSGTIDVRDGGTYAADAAVPYSAGVSYHFRLVINVPQHTYSVFVTPMGGSEVTLATDFAFRSEQSTTSTLSAIGVWVGSPTGSTTTVCNIVIRPGGPPPTPGTPVSLNGPLRVCGTTLCHQRGQPIQL
jgi:glucose/arabinose dehydrogenase